MQWEKDKEEEDELEEGEQRKVEMGVFRLSFFNFD